MSEKEPNSNRPGFGWLYMYTYTFGFFEQYDCYNNGADWNYIMRRKDVKEAQQDVFILVQTSAHHYTVAHYCVLDGFNEVRRFRKLFDAAQYLIRAMWDYDQKYAEWMIEQEKLQRERQQKKAEKEAKHAAKKMATTADEADSKYI